MTLRKARPEFFIPRGLADSYDQTMSFKGCCQKLINLVFDQANNGIVIARPGVTLLIDFSVTAPYNTKAPGAISVFIVVGTRIYGMIATNTTAGHEEPFCFETATGSFVPITGMTANNVPTNAGTTGQWNPPTMAMIGTKIIVTHPGFDGNVPNLRFFGVIDTTVPAAPTWISANTTVNPLPAPPIAVANFNNRAYYAVGNAVIFSDSLNPTVVTNATQVLTIGDTSAITALAPLPIGTGTQGVLAALLVFKGASNSIWQITGDPALALQPLTVNQLSSVIGCWAPRSIVPSPEGVKFIGIDGPYVVNLLGSVQPLVHDPSSGSQDLQDPFIQATQAQASRAAAGYNQGVYRVSLDTVFQNVAITSADFWFDEHNRRWNGPHTFPYHCAAGFGDAFILCSNTYPARLFVSQPAQHSTSVFTDQTSAAVFLNYQCDLLSALMPNRGDMQMNCIIESEVEVGRSAVSSQYTLTTQDQFGDILGSATLTLTSSGPIWGDPASMTWGAFVWGSGKFISQFAPIPWTGPVIFKRIAAEVIATAGQGVAFGTFAMRYQQLGYMFAAVS